MATYSGSDKRLQYLFNAGSSIAEDYNSTSGIYYEDDYCLHNGTLMKCIEDIDEPEEFDPEKWEEVKIVDEMGGGGGGGTTVIANPVGTPTDDLETIQIGNTIYDIPGGGGGNANIWTGTQAELEEVFDELEDGTQINIIDDEQEIVGGGTIYSEDEQMIGLWTNNKPLYQRTVKITGLARVTASTIAISASDLANLGIDASEVKEMEFALDYYYNGALTKFTQNTYLNNSSIIIVWMAGGNVYYWAQWGSATTGISIDLTLTFKYTKSTDSPLNAVVGKRTMYIASSDCYSTDEKEIGCNIDGKPLYQKSFIMPSAVTLNANAWTTVSAVNVPDAEECIKCLIFLGADNSQSAVFGEFLNGSFQMYTSIKLLVNRVTIQYTKSSDTAGSGQYTPAGVKADHYTEDEQVIGTWLGKPLYRKVLPVITKNSGGTNVTHNLGVKYYVNKGGWCYVNGDSNPRPFPFVQQRWNGYCDIQGADPNMITIDSSWNNCTIQCYIDYTKARDYT